MRNIVSRHDNTRFRDEDKNMSFQGHMGYHDVNIALEYRVKQERMIWGQKQCVSMLRGSAEGGILNHPAVGLGTIG